MTPARIVALVLAAAMAGYVAISFGRSLPEAVQRERQSRVIEACMPLEPTATNPVLGRFPVLAPELQAQDYTGKSVPLSAYRGKVVLLNFWASWCPPCVEEMPAMDQLARSMAGTDFVILAISADDSWAKIREFFGAGGTAMTVLWDPSAGQTGEQKTASLGHSYGTDKLPESYLIDKNGNIRLYVVNTRDWSSPDAQRCIRALLKE